MNANPAIHIPLALGSGLLTLSARGLGWCFARIMRAPLTAAGLFLMTAAYGLAMTNALYLQTEPHPAPMFLPAGAEAPTPSPVPELPRVEPVVVQPAEPPAAVEAAPTPPREAPVTIGNADVAELQQKLKDMGLFDGTVDGYYGPKTADAIRAFESRFGLPRTGAVSRQVLEAVRAAPATLSEAPAAQPVSEPVAEIAPPPPEAPPAETIDTLIAQAETASVALEEAVGAVAAEETRAEDASPFGALFAMAQIGSGEGAALQALVPAARDRELVSTIQRGLAKLGFLHGPVDGVAGETTARAIRNFEVFHSYRPTGEVRWELVDLLVAAGADL